MATRPPLIAHVIYQLRMGGLENGLVNLINHLPPEPFRHAIVCMTDYSDFQQRIRHRDVEIFALDKQPGRDPKVFFKLLALFRRLQPAIVHSRNLAGLDSLLPATLSGTRCKIHGEHGRDVADLDGSNRKYQWLRRMHKPLINYYVPLSKDLETYLRTRIGVPAARIRQIYNGVDTRRFRPPANGRQILPTGNFATADSVVIGTVGRLQAVKDQLGLIDAFAQLLRSAPDLRTVARLAIVGDGPLREQLDARIRDQHIGEYVWLAGARDDVADLLRGFDIFVLPSLAEGISNTILEAMASALPVIATRVGGNGELIVDVETGALTPPSDPLTLAKTLESYIRNREKRLAHGQAGRHRVERLFSLEAMVNSYLCLYRDALAKR